MSYTITSTEKRELADRLLKWFKENGKMTWTRTYDVISEAADALKEPIFQLYKALDVLLVMGRVERNNVIDYRPLTEPAKPRAGGLVLLKVPQERLDQFAPGQIEDFKRAFPDDTVIIIALDSDLMVGKAARNELTRLRDEINKTLERFDNAGKEEKS